MSVLVDTNILLRRIQPNHEQHALAIDSVARLLEAGIVMRPVESATKMPILLRPQSSLQEGNRISDRLGANRDVKSH